MSITEIDSSASKDSRRLQLVADAINNQECLVAEQGSIVAGFAMFSRCFFDNMFLKLMVVREECRRRGIATALISHIQRISPTTKLFTSTNRSNRIAQELFLRCGFEESGFIDNLDNNDPEIVYLKRIKRPVK